MKMKQKLIFTNQVGEAIDALVAELGATGVTVITDTGAAEAVLPLLENDSQAVAGASRIVVEAGDEHKNLESLAGIWERLSASEATRSGVVVNIGGGMVGDMGGFAAATFKRGMKCIIDQLVQP